MTEFSRLWMFNCGSPANYVIEAGGEREAMEVATAWCKGRGIRPPAAIRKMVVAGPEILDIAEGAAIVPVTPPVPAPAPVPQSFGEKVKAEVGL